MNQTNSPLHSGLSPAARICAWELGLATESDTGFKTPFGTFAPDIYLVGTLTEKSIPSLRISDPTGVFQIRMIRQDTPLIEQANSLAVPSFVAVFGTTRFHRYQGRTIAEIRPEVISIVNRSIRDQWLKTTALAAVSRLEPLPPSKERRKFAEILLHALDTVKEEAVPDRAQAVTEVSDEQLLSVITGLSGKKGALISEVLRKAEGLGMTETAAKAALARLMEEGECYTPTTELIKIA